MPPATKRRKPVRRSKVSTQTTLHVAGGASGNLAKAAQDIAEGIKSRAAEFSKKIPPSVHVGQGSATTATVYATAEPAYAIETGARHPLFGMTGRGDEADRSTRRDKKGKLVGHWYPMKQILFMEEGAARALDQAAEDYGFGEIDDWLKQVDW
jgi:hypothetical protein